jgi:hypothetical protein
MLTVPRALKSTIVCYTRQSEEVQTTQVGHVSNNTSIKEGISVSQMQFDGLGKPLQLFRLPLQKEPPSASRRGMQNCSICILFTAPRGISAVLGTSHCLLCKATGLLDDTQTTFRPPTPINDVDNCCILTPLWS